MRISATIASLFLATQVSAFVPSFGGARFSVSVKDTSAELGNPCEDECALDSFPNLPESVHPGVLTGQAQLDLLRHAKENGKDYRMKSFL